MIGDIIFLSNFLSSNCKVLGGASASRCSSTPRLLLFYTGCNFYRLSPQGDVEECTTEPRRVSSCSEVGVISTDFHHLKETWKNAQ